MSRNYSEEEKMQHLDQYKVSGKSKTEYARLNDIPEATFRAWVKEEAYSKYGILEETANSENNSSTVKVIRPVIFANENIRIELREGFDKEFLKRIIEVLVYDK